MKATLAPENDVLLTHLYDECICNGLSLWVILWNLENGIVLKTTRILRIVSKLAPDLSQSENNKWFMAKEWWSVRFDTSGKQKSFP